LALELFNTYAPSGANSQGIDHREKGTEVSDGVS